MSERYTVYINDKPLVFLPLDGLERPTIEGKYAVFAEGGLTATELLEKVMHEGTAQGFVCLCEHPRQSWLHFTDLFTLSVAAGGVVRSPDGKLLVIFRRGKWDLPKGKLDYEESPEHAAVREVMEECGLENVRLGPPILITFHTYTEKKKRILKKTHWFEMSADASQALVPQTEEDIEKAEWMTPDEVRTIVFQNTYGSIREVLSGVV